MKLYELRELFNEEAPLTVVDMYGEHPYTYRNPYWVPDVFTGLDVIGIYHEDGIMTVALDTWSDLGA